MIVHMLWFVAYNWHLGYISVVILETAILNLMGVKISMG